MPRTCHRKSIPVATLSTCCAVVLAGGLGWQVSAGGANAAAADKQADTRSLPAAAGRKVDYTRDILPILSARCFSCHGPDAQESGLRLDRSFGLKGDSGLAVVPGKGADSMVVQLAAGVDPERKMPPEGKRLTPEEIGLLRAWIDQGATMPANTEDDEYLKLWSLQPLTRPAVPAPQDTSNWIASPIDAFVLSRLQAAGLTPSPRADRTTLIRRLSLDLLGLPPTPAEVDAFVADTRPDAFEKLVDRLLASEHFGERWGRHWLDLARYADSDGYEKDRPRLNAWRWRDWVIEAINADMPFDEFTIEQLAGDLLPEATPEQILATAFHRQTLTNTEGGTDKEQFRVEATFDRVATTGAVWLGLTVGCAQCHSHKYDRISQEEYYRLFAFFNNGDEANTEIAISEQAMAKYRQDLAAYQTKTAGLKDRLSARRQAVLADQPALEQAVREELAALSGTPVVQLPTAPAEVKSKGGLKFDIADDASVRASGKNLATDTYTVLLQVPPAEDGEPIVPFTGFRLEALPDPSLGGNGPGRTAHGNFVLTHITVAAAADRQLKDAKRSIPLTSPTASHSQDKFGPQGSLNPDAKTGWAVSPRFGKPSQVVYRFADSTTVKPGEWLQITLKQEYGSQHLLGRFRLSLRTGQDADDVAPESVRRILAIEDTKRTPEQTKMLVDYLLTRDTDARQLAAQLKLHAVSAPKEPKMTVRVLLERTANPRETHILRRGDFLQPQAKVEPGTFGILPALPSPASGARPTRLDLARWLVSPENPLTPRVTVNRVWSHLFGEGLVTTPEDFGIRGEQPTHPELLDWLASEFMEQGWSRKALIRRIVLSATWQQSSAHRQQASEVDPQNRLLHRQNRFRVEAEIIRDVSLAASGLLSRKIGGPSVFPPMAADVAALSYANNFRWNTSTGPDRYRRGMYTFFKRTSPYPNLVTFDCPDGNTATISRSTSNTPLQALATLNNTVYIDAARSLAQQAMNLQEATADSASEAAAEPKTASDHARLTHAFRRCVARQPTSTEISRLQDLLETSRRWYADHPDEALKLAGSDDHADAGPVELAAWVATARILLNMDEFLTRE